MIRHAVSEYEPVGSAAEILLQYPFARPDFSFMTDGVTIHDMPENYDEFVSSADNYLRTADTPLISERVPVIAYGANASPYKLQAKMAEYPLPDEGIAAEVQIIPNLRVKIPDVVVAWHGKPGQSGSAFAELYKGPETEGKSAEAFVQFLTKEQLALMHASEGVTYHFADIPVLAGNDERPVTAYAYVAGNSEVLLRGGEPIQVAAASLEKGSMTAREAVTYMLRNAGVMVSPEQYVTQAPKMLKDKKTRQAAVRASLAANNLSEVFSYPGSTPDTSLAFIGRASLTPNLVMENGKVLVHMMEMDIERLRPAKAERSQSTEAKFDKLMAEKPDRNRDAALKIARERIDIAAKLRSRASRELADYYELTETAS